MKASTTLKALTLLAFAMSSTTALAFPPRFGGNGGGMGPAPSDMAERFVLEMNGREFNSSQGEDTIPLKALIQQKYGDQDLRGADLVRVAIFAKSRFGRGQISLLVGRDLGRPTMIDGSPREFDGPYGYQRYVLANESRDSLGVWQLKLSGNLKIQRIAVVVRKQSRSFVLNLGGQEFNSDRGEDTVMLKALIQRTYGQVDLRNMDLVRVSVMAKSHFGRGQMSLLTDRGYSQAQIIGGNPRDYFSPGGFGLYSFQSMGDDSAGVWQLKLSGNIKIGQITVEARER